MITIQEKLSEGYVEDMFEPSIVKSLKSYAKSNFRTISKKIEDLDSYIDAEISSGNKALERWLDNNDASSVEDVVEGYKKLAKIVKEPVYKKIAVEIYKVFQGILDSED